MSRSATARQAYLHLDGWAGLRQWAVLVVGETPKRYRIRAVMDNTPLPRRRIMAGQEALVPKYAVSFS